MEGNIVTHRRIGPYAASASASVVCKLEPILASTASDASAMPAPQVSAPRVYATQATLVEHLGGHIVNQGAQELLLAAAY